MNNKLKIAFIAPSFPPISGGMGTACYYTANEISKEYDCTVFLADRKIKYNSGNFKIKTFKPIFSYGYADFAPHLIKQLKYFDIIHLYYPYFGIAEFLFLLQKKNKKSPKIIFHYQMDMVGSGLSKFVAFLHKKFCMPVLFKKVDLVFVLSTDYAQNSDLKKYYKKYKSKFKVAPNGVDIEIFSKIHEHKIESAKEKLGFKKTDKIIFTAQALDKAHFFKGIDVLIKSIKQLDRSDIKLLIAGNGNLKNKYKKLAQKLDVSDRVIFLGTISHDFLPLYYSLADVTAVPSTRRTESFSITAAESMACETPVIVSNWPGLRVTPENNVSGLIIKPNNETDLAKKILEFVDNPKKLQSFGSAGRKKVESEYTWPKISENIITEYNKLLIL